MSLDVEFSPRSWGMCRGMEEIAAEDARRSAELLALVKSEARQVRSRADLLAERGQCSAKDCRRIARGIGEPPLSGLCGRCYSRHGRGEDVWSVAEASKKRGGRTIHSIRVLCPCGTNLSRRMGSLCSTCAEKSRGRANR